MSNTILEIVCGSVGVIVLVPLILLICLQIKKAFKDTKPTAEELHAKVVAKQTKIKARLSKLQANNDKKLAKYTQIAEQKKSKFVENAEKLHQEYKL